MNAQFSQQDTVMTMGEWLITLIILCIPIVNIIMMLVWAFSGGTNANKRNFCRAYLIIVVAFIILYILFAIVFGAAIMSATHGMNGAALFPAAHAMGLLGM